ncbi:MAG TPA: bifunctional glutamate N-acetyltransferase/amino-acid acetyltransferase ArgJ [Bryobacteraceae bacterium]|nr:bifunctional glutamate N-acetyltransferase/amino-acid acetyltransferase ArgJ [Bryobacteraceae bacterium]
MNLNLPLEYRYAATYAGIRKDPGDDLALIVSDKPAHAAAVFTRNMVQAAPVRLARRHIRSSGGKLSAILVNAGNANCATRAGDKVAKLSCKATARALETKTEYILPASTGVIGVELDPKLITEALPKLVSSLSANGFEQVARAILTTDTRMKVASEQVTFANGSVRIAGMTKGAGMIHPNMATTLGFVLTDAVLSAKELRGMLAAALDRSYHSLTVDGDMSTNDTVVLAANGASKLLLGRKERPAVQGAVTSVMESLARQIAADGEGARKLIIVDAEGFKTDEDAKRIARAISNSPLVKTAIAGSDPNWGRILSAAGYSGVVFNPNDVDVYLQGIRVCRAGRAADFDEAALKSNLDTAEVHVRVVRSGWSKGHARFFTCDLTEGYIQINGSYRT